MCMPAETTSKNASGVSSSAACPTTPFMPLRVALTDLGTGRTREAIRPTPGIVMSRKNGSARTPGSATAGMPMATTAVTRAGASSAMHNAHIAPSDVPTSSARSRPSASSADVSCATA